MVDTKDGDNSLLRLSKCSLQYNLLRPYRRHQIYIPILWCNKFPEIETWSFDKAINEVFRLLPEKLCPKPSEDHTPSKPLSGIEQLMGSRSTPLLVLPQSKLAENTTKFIQDRLNWEKLDQDWLCPQQLVTSLAPIKYYRSKNQYFQAENVPQLESDASKLDMPSKGKYSVPIRNIEFWERRASKLVAINSHADLLSSAAYLCLQQELMSVNALSRLLAAVAKSIKHATAMSTTYIGHKIVSG